MNTDWIRCDENVELYEAGSIFIKKALGYNKTYTVVEIQDREWAGGDGYSILVGEVDLHSDLVPWTIVPLFHRSIPQPYTELTNPKDISNIWKVFRSSFIGYRINVGDKEQLLDELVNFRILRE
ncbi:hypothetical protein [Bacillus phage vB_BtM_BMBsp2]|nr:hypothetical protein [Bacillus phage vB_BtM_BMBsp2]